MAWFYQQKAIRQAKEAAAAEAEAARASANDLGGAASAAAAAAAATAGGSDTVGSGGNTEMSSMAGSAAVGGNVMDAFPVASAAVGVGGVGSFFGTSAGVGPAQHEPQQEQQQHHHQGVFLAGAGMAAPFGSVGIAPGMNVGGGVGVGVPPRYTKQEDLGLYPQGASAASAPASAPPQDGRVEPIYSNAVAWHDGLQWGGGGGGEGAAASLLGANGVPSAPKSSPLGVQYRGLEMGAAAAAVSPSRTAANADAISAAEAAMAADQNMDIPADVSAYACANVRAQMTLEQNANIQDLDELLMANDHDRGEVPEMYQGESDADDFASFVMGSTSGAGEEDEGFQSLAAQLLR